MIAESVALVVGKVWDSAGKEFMRANEVFVNNTNLTFLYKISIKVS